MGWSTYLPCRAGQEMGWVLIVCLSYCLIAHPGLPGRWAPLHAGRGHWPGDGSNPMPDTYLGLKLEHTFPGAKLHSFWVIVLKSSCLCIFHLVDTPPLGLDDSPLNLCSVPAQWPWSACLLTGKPCSGLGSGVGRRQLSCFPGETIRKETSIGAWLRKVPGSLCNSEMRFQKYVRLKNTF